jgi:aspartate aminotransferase
MLRREVRMVEGTDLGRLRSEIEKVTLEIVDLIGKRTDLVMKVGKEKARTGAALVNREVEQQLRSLVIERSEKVQIDTRFVLRMLNQLIMESIRTQKGQVVPNDIPNAYTTMMKAKELEKRGKEIIHLEVGEPDFGPPAPVVDALYTAVKQGRTSYSSSAGIPELKEKIAEQLNQRHGLALTPENVMVAVGGRFALTLSVESRIDIGDEVIIIDPSYPAYANCVTNLGGRPVHVVSTLEDNWEVDMGELEDSINQSTRLIILNNPCNPTGKSLSKSTFERIVEVAIKNNIQIVSDEVYSNFIFSSNTSILEFPNCSQVFVDSFSKTYGMTGFRLGYAVSDVETIQRITKLQNLYLTCVPEFVQAAGVAAIDCEAEAYQFAEMIEKRLDVICKELEKTPLSFYRPDGGFYIFPRIDEENQTGIEFSNQLLNESGVAVVPGVAYGLDFDRFFRISICRPEKQLIEAAKKIAEVLG